MMLAFRLQPKMKNKRINETEENEEWKNRDNRYENKNIDPVSGNVYGCYRKQYSGESR